MINQKLNNRSGEAKNLNNIGAVHNTLGQSEKALNYYNQALLITRQINEPSEEAKLLNNIGGVYQASGAIKQALAYFNQALSIHIKVGIRPGEATALNNIGGVYLITGELKKASAYFSQALSILREIGDMAGEAKTLTNIGTVYSATGQPQKALDYYSQALPIFREVGDRLGIATTLNNIGLVYNSIGQPEKALNYYNQALPIRKEVGDRIGEAVALNNIGAVYDDINPQKALDYYNQALLIRKEVGDRLGEATTLHNIGMVYNDINQPQKALDYENQALAIFKEFGNRPGIAGILHGMGRVYLALGQPQEALNYLNQALPIIREVNNISQEAAALGNIAYIYQGINRPDEAIKYWEKSVAMTLQIRAGLKQDNQQQTRQRFLQSCGCSGDAIPLTSLLIDQNQADRAFEWINIATTADLADYTRLINAKVKNPEAQQLIDQWNQRSQQIQFLYRQLQDKPSDQLSQQINQLQEENNKLAEKIRRQFPEVAELFETTPKDIAQLKASIAPDTAVIQPVLLTNVNSVPDTVALFVLTKNSLSVKKIPINPAEFDKLLTEHREKLSSELSGYKETGSKLYDILIRPVEEEIKALSPKQLSIIATGKLRYIPFETLYDRQNSQFLIQKYPVNYLTRISTRTIPNSTLQGGILALGNPVTRDPYNLPDSPQEVQSLTQIFPGSLSYIGNAATLDQFKTQAPRFPFLHLSTHGCFQPEGCCLPNSPNCRKPDRVDLQPNTILFADRELDIADAALLGLQNTRLLTLSACQTALQANSNGEEISGVAYVFERAGARAVMASLWSVSDSATKELMVEFYQNINKGMSKNEALQQAKLSQIQRTPHPSYWSPFILIGDGR